MKRAGDGLIGNLTSSDYMVYSVGSPPVKARPGDSGGPMIANNMVLGVNRAINYGYNDGKSYCQRLDVDALGLLDGLRKFCVPKFEIQVAFEADDATMVVADPIRATTISDGIVKQLNDCPSDATIDNKRCVTHNLRQGTVTLTSAIDKPGYVFDGWNSPTNGDCPCSDSTSRTCTFEMEEGDHEQEGDGYTCVAKYKHLTSCPGIPGGLGAWTLLTSAEASTIDTTKNKQYLYVAPNEHWYLSPITTLSWNWNGGQLLTGSYKYCDGVNEAEYTCSNRDNNEPPDFGIGCSDGLGGEWKTVPLYTKDPAAGQCNICQDYPNAFGGAVCQDGISIYYKYAP